MAFEVVPAVDVSEGRVVRVEQGDLRRKTVYGDDPVSVARDWESAGAPRLHVVDLDGAVAGEPRNGEAIRALVAATGIPVQVAGGIRSVETVRELREAGADRLVLGTAALTDPAFLRAVLGLLGERLVVALDSRDGELRIDGWTRGSGMDLVQTAVRLAEQGVRRLLVTDIGRDGMLRGPNLEAIAAVADAARVPVLASGGVSSVDDLRALAATGVEGAIVGKALYSGAIALPEALEAVGGMGGLSE